MAGGLSEVFKGVGGFFILISMFCCVGDGGLHRPTNGKHDGRGLSEVFKGVGGFFILISMCFYVSVTAVSTVTQTDSTGL